MTDRHRQTGRQTEILYYLQYLLVLRSKNRVFVPPLIFFPSRFMESAIHCTETLHFNSPLEADLHIF